MKKTALFLSIIFFLFNTLPAWAEEGEITAPPLELEELTIQVLPEYSYHPEDKEKDHPPLLVGYHGSLRNVTDEPIKGQVEIPLPMDDKDFHIGFVGDYSADLTNMYAVEYAIDEKNGMIRWGTSEEIEPGAAYKFVIEYYTDSIKEADGKKALDYKFKNFVDIGLMNLIFVEPLKTDSFALEPSVESHQENTYGMNMFSYTINGMKAGEETRIHLEYERAEDRTTTEMLEAMVEASTPQGTTTKNEERIPTWMVISVVGGVSVIVAAGLVFFLRKEPNEQTEKQNDTPTEVEIKKAKLRAMLLDESITEEEYNELFKKIGGK